MDVTLHARIGGAATVTTTVDALYRALLGDDLLAGYFTGAEPDVVG